MSWSKPRTYRGPFRAELVENGVLLYGQELDDEGNVAITPAIEELTSELLREIDRALDGGEG